MVVAGILATGFLVAWLWHVFGHTNPATNPRYEAVIAPEEGGTAYAVEGAFTLNYEDKGDRVELSISAQADPILDVDVNQDGQVDAGDLSYATDGRKPCVRRLDTADQTGVCDPSLSKATVKVQETQNAPRVTWNIPKSELQIGGKGADIVIEAFLETSQSGKYYPETPFKKVYHLTFADVAPHPPLHASEEPSTPPAPANPADRPASASGTPDTSIQQPESPLPTAPQIAKFTAIPQSIQPGGSATLAWSVSQSDSVEIEPGIGVVASEGERPVSPQQTMEYTLTAKGSGGSSSREVTVSVEQVPAPQIDSFVTDVGTVAAGGTARLSWSVSGSVSGITIDPGFDSLPAKGERSVTVNQTTDYTLTASGAGGRTSAKLTIRAAPVPPRVTLDATPSTVRAGEAATVRWNVSGASKITLYPGGQTVGESGSMVVKPTNTIRVSILAEGPGGSTVRDATVFVSRPAEPSSGQIIWNGEVRGLHLITIDGDHADFGQLQGALPGRACIIQPVDEKNVTIASAPGPRNNYDRLILRVNGKGKMTIVVNWTLQ
jgi:hypothetical protein